MANRRIQWTVGFNADTSELERALNQAFQSLDRLGTTPQVVPYLQQASAAAIDLANNLHRAYNTDTGKLDLRKLNEEMQRSGRTLQQYYDQLVQLGPRGQQAFGQVAEAITSAELPLRRSNKLLSDLWITMKNTMRWQLTSSVLNKFVGGLETAYGYAKDLNESLNNIRIVTGKSTDDMAKFADQANKAAKALSTTTTNYTDASLIYYRQGLSDQEAQARADATIKYANVSGLSTTEAAEQLTAVWNNFAKGSESLEYYIDVMTRLGATTASSSEEISTGMQKFAAVADTVGLSYEYAASALATIMATTRQDADMVGTSLRTIFARLQSLKLGDTLDDGTKLSNYTAAMAKVGVTVKDVNGNLRNMDDILEDLGARWQTLASDQKVALAQTVAGVRQYAQLIALMDNWDFMQTNLDTARNSEGELERQAAIYAESWEAARDRVTAAAEDIYDSVINDKMFIDLDNMFTPFLTFLANVVDGMGGFSGLLAGGVVLINQLFGDKIAATMRDFGANIGLSTREGVENLREIQREAARLQEILAQEVQGLDGPAAERVRLQSRYVDLQQEAAAAMDRLTEHQREAVQHDMDRVKRAKETADYYAEQAIHARETADALQDQLDERLDGAGINRRIVSNSITARIQDLTRTNSTGDRINADGQILGQDQIRANDLLADSFRNLSASLNSAQSGTQFIRNLVAQLRQLTEQRTNIRAATVEYERMANALTGTVTDETLNRLRQLAVLAGMDQAQAGAANLQQLTTYLDQATDHMFELESDSQAITAILQEFVPETSLNNLTRFIAALQQGYSFEEAFRMATDDANHALDEQHQRFLDNQYAMRDWADVIVEVGQLLGQVGMMMNSISSIGNIITDEDLSGGEKAVRLLTALGMLIPIVTRLISEHGNIVGIAGIRTAYWTAHNAALAASNTAVAATIQGIGAAINTALPIIGIVIAAIGAAVAIINALINAQQKAIEKAVELHKSNREEIESNQELIESYEELYKKYQETGEGKEDLAKKALEVADKFGLEGAAIANLTGDYEKLNEQIREKQRLLNQESLDNDRIGKSAYEDALESAMRKGAGHANFVTGKYHVALGGQTKAGDKAAATAQYSALEETDFYKDYYQFWGNDFVAPDSSGETLAKMYEKGLEAEKAMREAQAKSGEDPSKLYKNLTSWLAKSQAAYEEYQGVLEDIKSKSFQDIVYNTGDTEDIKSFSQYTQYYNELTKAVQESADFKNLDAEAQKKLIDTYVSGVDNLKRYATQQQTLNVLTEKFGTDITKNKDVLEGLEHLTDTQMVIALKVATDSNSVNEFKQKFDQAMLESTGVIAQTSMHNLAGMMTELSKNKKSYMTISDDNYNTLKSDAGFMDSVTADFGNFDEFRKRATRDQIEYIRDYYTAVSVYAIENLEQQKANAEQELAIAANKQEALIILEKNYSEQFEQLAKLREEYSKATSEEEKQAILEQWNELQKEINGKLGEYAKENFSDDSIDFSVNFDIEDATESIDSLTDYMDSIIDKIDEINEQRIEIAADWDDFDDIKSQFDTLAAFAKAMQKDAIQMGDSYQYPISAVRDWMEIYPDLFDDATVAKNGMLEINKDIVDDYIQGRKDETNANAAEKIEQWKLLKADLEAERDALTAKIDAFQKGEQAKIDITALSDEEQGKLAQQLHQYLLDNGVDEATAHQQVLTTMGINEEKYSELVAKVSQANYDNTKDSAEEGGQAAVKSISKVSMSWKNLGHNVFEVGKIVAAALKGEKYEANWEDVFTFEKESASFAGVKVDEDFETVDIDPAKAAEEFKAQQLKELNVDLSAINEAISNIDAKILAAEALQNQPAAGTGDNKGSAVTRKNRPNDVAEHFHEINNLLEYQEKLIKRIDTEIGRAYGTQRLELYEKKINALLDQQDYLERKMDEAENGKNRELNTLKNEFGNAVVDPESGVLLNYTPLLIEITKRKQDVYDAYNALADAGIKLDEAGKNEWDKKLKFADEEYDRQKKVLENYENANKQWWDAKEEFEQSARDIFDAKLSQLSYKLELYIDVKDMKDKARQYSKTIAESFGDVLTHGAQSGQYGFEQAKADMKLIPVLQQQYADLKKMRDEAGSEADFNALTEKMKDLQDKLISTGEALLDWSETLENMVPNAVSAAAERFSWFIDQLSHADTIADSIKELYALQGVTIKTAEGFRQLQAAAQVKVDNAIASSKLNRQMMEGIEPLLKNAEAEFKALNGDETNPEYDMRKKKYEAYLAEYNKYQEALYSSAQSAMQGMQEMYTQSIEKAMYDFDRAVSDGVGLDWLQERFERYTSQEERYYDAVNEAYQVQSWYNKIQADLDDKRLLTHKNELKELQEEINLRREGNTLSKYDMDILNAKYNLLQAQIALEEAQNAKNDMRLVRDRQGNWNYQYTANPDEIHKAQQAVLDAQNEYYNIAKAGYKDTVSQIISTKKEYEKALSDIYNDTTLSDEEQHQKRKELEAWFNEEMTQLYAELDVTAQDMRDAGKEAIDDFKDTYIEDLGNMAGTLTEFESSSDELIGNCNGYWDDYKGKVKEVAKELGVSAESDGTEALPALDKALQDIGNSASNMATAAGLSVDDMIGRLGDIDDLTEHWNNLAEAMKAVREAEGTSNDIVGDVASKLGFREDTDYSEIIQLINRAGTSSEYYGLLGELYNQRQRKRESSATYSKWADNDTLMDKIAGELGTGITEDEQKLLEDLLKQLRNEGYISFSTGGYTGEFSDAKLAFLHQKELVLNQDDTANLLTAVDALRALPPSLFTSIEHTLDGNAQAAMVLMAEKMGGYGAVAAGGQTLEQHLTIEHVEFPNVSSADEIEKALIGLVNDAAQYTQIRKD